MKFNGLDLNLLVALDALMTERSVSEAANRIGVTQSAMSAALGRLREFFGDNLLVNVGRRMVLTPRAETLAQPVHETLLRISGLIAQAPEFDPAASTRHFEIIASDYIVKTVLARAIGEATRMAPNIRFTVRALGDSIETQLERAEVDLLIMIAQYLSPGHPSELLFEEDYVVVGWSGNPKLASPLDVDTFCALRHVSVSHGRNHLPTFETLYMADRGPGRIIDVVVSAFTDVGDMLVGTERIATVHRRLAHILCREQPLTMHELPFPIPPVKLMAQWHHIRKNDQELRWFLDILHTVCDAA
ncbi:MAG: LysR family transcriptional regulator [Alphaproteobacteria bacterium]|nr:LysR family transcriptional regulator [Alphaproteobacteria bacterium]